MCAVVLKRLGHDVRVFEQLATSQRQGQTASIGLFEHVQAFFKQHDRLSHLPLGF